MLYPSQSNPGVIDKFCWLDGGTWHHSPLSNGFIEPDGTFVEREYQASKASDPVEALAILSCEEPFGPTGSKVMGRAAKQRTDWDEVKYQVMVRFVLRKFLDHPELAEFLLGTGDALIIEGNTWHDNIWGDCCCGKADHPECAKPGLNWLGHVHMGVREALRQLTIRA